MSVSVLVLVLVVGAVCGALGWYAGVGRASARAAAWRAAGWPGSASGPGLPGHPPGAGQAGADQAGAGQAGAGQAGAGGGPGLPAGQPGPGVLPADAASAVGAALDAVARQLQATERERAAAHAALSTEVSLLRQASEQVRRETSALTTALRSPQVRGRWGETQLRRVLELGGALEHCDFGEQETARTSAGGLVRPDVLVHLAGGKHLVVDAKVPLQSFLAAAEATDDAARLQHLADHARAVRAHVSALAGRDYARAVGSPEFVVLFLPGEAFLDAALRADPALQEAAFGADVVLATPATLLALIRTVAYTWRQERLADGAHEITRLGRELHDRLATVAGHLAKVGTSLRSSVDAYNSTLGSLEARVLPSARRLSKLVSDGSTPRLLPVPDLPRTPSAPELLPDRHAPPAPEADTA